MTREELIEMLNILLDNAEIGCADITVIKHVSFDSFKFVIEKAIKALSQECVEPTQKHVGNALDVRCDKCRNKRTSICGNCKEYDEYEPCDDAISRDAAIDKVNDALDEWDGGFNKFRANLVENAIRELPPVTQKSDNKYRKEAKRWKNKWLKSQKSGKWLYKEITDDYRVTGQCSECKERRIIDNYCPNCGCRMVEPQESEEQTE